VAVTLFGKISQRGFVLDKCRNIHQNMLFGVPQVVQVWYNIMVENQASLGMRSVNQSLLQYIIAIYNFDMKKLI